MDRLACISVPSLPLQIALRRLPPGPAIPVALVKEDRPSSLLLQLNRPARERGLRPGMRYSEGLSIVADLQAAVVLPDELAAARHEILQTLSRWSPRFEVCPYEQGSFWVDASGLSGLYGSEAGWGAGVRAALAGLRYRAVVVVGLTRGGTYVLARSRRRSTVVRSREAEVRALEAAPLSIFPLTARHRRILAQLGVKSLSGVLALPAEELARRFGPELVRDLRVLADDTRLPLQQTEAAEPWSRVRRLEPPVSDRQALVPLVEEPLVEGLDELRRRGRLLAELRVVLVLESGSLVTEVLRPAEPTTRRDTLVRLLELRLARCELPEPVAELRLGLVDVAAPTGSGELFAPPRLRDPRKGAEALALIRAHWGNAAVVRPVPADSHIPELSYRWEEADRVLEPVLRPPVVPFATAVRRVALGPRRHDRNPAGRRLGASCRLRVSAGSVAVDKEYWFLRNTRGEVAWVSWDKQTQKPGWEGTVD
jgi:protein ImuB